MPVNRDDMLDSVVEYYSARVRQLGPTPAGVDYNSTEAQQTRFRQLLRLFGDRRTFSLNDVGCGYAAFYLFLQDLGYQVRYHGCDRSQEMIDQARILVEHGKEWDFCRDASELQVADYTVACALFNVKLDAGSGIWEDFILSSLDMMAEKSTVGFAFNMLTAYSDKDHMRPDLYYGDPVFFFDLCKKKYSSNVALLHDYGLYDFTILVRLGRHR